MVPMAGVTVCLEGLPGSGKSTVLEQLARTPDDNLTYVRDDDWGATDRSPFACLLCSLLTLSDGGGAAQRVVERSPLSYRHVFAQMMFNDNVLTQQQWEVYKELHGELGRAAPDLIIFLQVPFEECMRRTDGAAGTPEYLQRVEFLYDTMLRYENVPVVRVDATQSPTRVAAAVRDLITKARERAGCPGVATTGTEPGWPAAS